MREFPLSAVALLRCPAEGGALYPLHGESCCATALRCARCGARYPIVDGILDLLSASRPSDETAEREIRVRDEQAPIYDSFFTEVASEIEIGAILDELGSRRGLILELGCGTGRITTRLLPRASLLLAVDFSRESLRELARRESAPNLALILADATRLRLAPNRFDAVVSAEALEHVPSLAARTSLYRSVNHALGASGVFVCTAYHFGIPYWRDRREGFHQSRIYYRRFTIQDLTQELSSELKVQTVRPIRIGVPFASRLGISPARISRVLEGVPLLRLLGDLLIARAEKTEEAPARALMLQAQVA